MFDEETVISKRVSPPPPSPPTHHALKAATEVRWSDLEPFASAIRAALAFCRSASSLGDMNSPRPCMAPAMVRMELRQPSMAPNTSILPMRGSTGIRTWEFHTPQKVAQQITSLSVCLQPHLLKRGTLVVCVGWCSVADADAAPRAIVRPR